jgi:hypothetical protein
MATAVSSDIALTNAIVASGLAVLGSVFALAVCGAESVARAVVAWPVVPTGWGSCTVAVSNARGAGAGSAAAVAVDAVVVVSAVALGVTTSAGAVWFAEAAGIDAVLSAVVVLAVVDVETGSGAVVPVVVAALAVDVLLAAVEAVVDAAVDEDDCVDVDAD